MHLFNFLALQHVGSYFPNQGSKLHSLQWKQGVLTTGPPGKSKFFFFLMLMPCCWIWLTELVSPSVFSSVFIMKLSQPIIITYLTVAVSSLMFVYICFPGSSVVKNSPAMQDLTPGSGRFPWRRKWQPTPVFLPGESHGQPGRLQSIGLQELDMT